MAKAKRLAIADRVLAGDREYSIHSLYTMLGESRFNAFELGRSDEPEEISGLTSELAWDPTEKAWRWTAAGPAP